MDPTALLLLGKNSLGGKAWSSELVLRVGADLAQAVNYFEGISEKDKSEIVCQTILKMLEDGEKAEKEHAVESTEKEGTKVPWHDCKKVVESLLPVILELLSSKKQGTSSFSWPVFSWAVISRLFQQLRKRLPSLGCFSAAAAASLVAAPAPAPSLSHLEEIAQVRELYNKVDAMLKKAQELALQPVCLHTSSPSNNDIPLPGELETQAGEKDTQSQ
jgi:hypothetical protein